jgi:hypothetical protein
LCLQHLGRYSTASLVSLLMISLLYRLSEASLSLSVQKRENIRVDLSLMSVDICLGNDVTPQLETQVECLLD